MSTGQEFKQGDRVEWDLFDGQVHAGKLVRDAEPSERVPGTWVAQVLPDRGPPSRPFAASTLRPAKRVRR